MAVFFIVYGLLLLRIDPSWYENDGHFIVHRLIGGEPVQPRHWLLETVVRPFVGDGSDVAAMLRYVSAGGVALACATLHSTATALGLSRSRAIFAGMSFAATGFAVLFGTVVEFHGLFSGLAALVIFLAFRVGLALRADEAESAGRTLWRACVVGCASGFAAFAHATGQLLPGLACLLVLSSGSRAGRAIVSCLAIVAVHFAVAVVVPMLFTALDGDVRDAQEAASYLAAHGDAWNVDVVTLLRDLGAVAWREWLVPYCAISIAWVFALRRGVRRYLLWPFLLFFIGQLLVTRLLLGGEESVMNESGAYMVPSALMACLLTAQCLPRVGGHAIMIVLVGVGLAFGLRHRADRHVTPDRFVQRAEVLDRHAPADSRIWTQDLVTIGALLDTRPHSGFFITHALMSLGKSAIEANVPVLMKKLEDELGRGRVLVVTASALEYLRDDLPGGGAILSAFEARMTARDVGEGDDALRIYRFE